LLAKDTIGASPFLDAWLAADGAGGPPVADRQGLTENAPASEIFETMFFDTIDRIFRRYYIGQTQPEIAYHAFRFFE
jgi:hypothetical protein